VFYYRSDTLRAVRDLRRIARGPQMIIKYSRGDHRSSKEHGKGSQEKHKRSR
jgi:hypothetical protein